ncbi:MAG: DNA-binding transcriptional LysR family regulator [Patiriisocius sp.]|jgi:DNA-binding transcriptional LysR family regulator
MSYQLEYRHLRYFQAVAKDLHFRKAAERLYISQPGLSKQIKELEGSLGISLFERHNRKVELTKAGAFLKEELNKHFKELDHIIQHAQLLDGGQLGDLKFGYVGSAMQQVIPDLLVNFKKKHPNVLLNLKELDNEKQVQGLLSRDIDIGFVRLERIPRSINAHPVLVEPFCLVLPTKHKLNDKNFKNLSQLKDESFILFDANYSPSYYEKVMQIFDDSGFAPIVTHNTIDSDSIYKLVQNNFGISIVPKSLMTKRVKGIKFIELTKIKQRTTLSVIWDKNNRNPMLKSILEIILNG